MKKLKKEIKFFKNLKMHEILTYSILLNSLFDLYDNKLRLDQFI